MPRALVTGGTGFIGSHVVRTLLAQKVSVRCLVRPKSNRANLQGLSVELVEGDVNDTASLRPALKECDYVFHVAADYRLWVKDPAEMERTNVSSTREFLLAAAEAGAKKIVFTSSVAAVGRPVTNSGLGVGDESIDPTTDQQIGPYKRTKFASDLAARELAAQGAPIVIVNPSAPIGPQDIKPTPTGKMIVDLLNGKMPAYLDTGMNFVAVQDVAVGHWLAAEKGRVGERYILGGVNLTLKQFLDKVAAAGGCKSPTIKMPYAVAWLAGAVSTGFAALTDTTPTIPLDGVRMAHAPMYYTPAKAVRELGLPQTPIDNAIAQSVEWFASHGYVRN
jgi:dihydroflavonol-4-reductase